MSEDYQIDLRGIPLLDAPTCDELHTFAGAARTFILMAMGCVSHDAGGIHKPAKTKLGTYLFQNEGIRGAGMARYAIMTAEKRHPREDGPVLKGSHSMEDDGHLIEMVWNPEYSAMVTAHVLVPLFHDVLATIAHESAHAIDPMRKDRGAVNYQKEKGAKQGHRYWHNVLEMRARVFSSQVSCLFQYLRMQDVGEAPNAESSDDDWDRFFSGVRFSDLAWFSDSNREFVCDQLREILPTFDCDAPPIVTPSALAKATKGPDYEWVDDDAERKKRMREIDEHNATYAMNLWAKLDACFRGRSKQPPRFELWDPVGEMYYGDE